MEIPNYGVVFKLTFEPFLCSWNCSFCHCRYKGKSVPKLQCVASKYLLSPFRLPWVEIIIKCKGSSIEVPVNYTILSFVSKKFRLVERNITCRRRNQLVWIIPRRFRYCLGFFKTLDMYYLCYVRKKEANWDKKFLQWMKIDFYEHPFYKKDKLKCCAYPPKPEVFRRLCYYSKYWSRWVEKRSLPPSMR